MIIHAPSIEQNIDTVCEVFERLCVDGWKISLRKLQLAKNTVEFLGVLWDKNKISIPKSRVEAILNYKVPKNYKELKRYLGVLSFYRSNLPRLAHTTADLSELANKGQPRKGYIIPKFKWDSPIINLSNNQKCWYKNTQH